MFEEAVDSATAPEPVAEPAWTPTEVPMDSFRDASYVSGDPHGTRLRVAYYLRGADGALVAKVWFGPGASGPPGHAHGGAMAAVLDEILGMSAWMAGHRVLGASLTTRFLKMLPLGTDTTVEAEVVSVKSRRVSMRGRILDPSDGTVFAEADGVFVKFGPQQLRHFSDIAAERSQSDAG